MGSGPRERLQSFMCNDGMHTREEMGYSQAVGGLKKKQRQVSRRSEERMLNMLM